MLDDCSTYFASLDAQKPVDIRLRLPNPKKSTRKPIQTADPGGPSATESEQQPNEDFSGHDAADLKEEEEGPETVGGDSDYGSSVHTVESNAGSYQSLGMELGSPRPSLSGMGEGTMESVSGTYLGVESIHLTLLYSGTCPPRSHKQVATEESCDPCSGRSQREWRS